jgi:hypothetical protein
LAACGWKFDSIIEADHRNRQALVMRRALADSI